VTFVISFDQFKLLDLKYFVNFLPNFIIFGGSKLYFIFIFIFDNGQKCIYPKVRGSVFIYEY
jgi:hypothetical protein